ncbi:protein FAM81B [Pygocentrus nattereri]|uniref:protein FAM81B n=1 Tax=Pygocentrus nattereri TaxID=42514 RepID=UPI001890EA53|nr:protein FAM81B [Pygocentrus nattereri]
MTGQERTLATLLQQAFQIKEDMVNSLRTTQGSLLMEASARKFLENHVQTITHIVKQLSKDIQVLESQIVQRDNVTSGTRFAVQMLDHKNLTGIGDLRGRVARCDASIAQLSGNVKARELEIMKLQREVGEMQSGIDLRLRDMELKISQSLGRLEASNSEQTASQKNTTANLQRDIHQLETKTASDLKELDKEAARLRSWTEQQLSSTAQTHTEHRHQLRTLLQDRMNDMEVKLKAHMDLFSAHVEKQLEKEHSADRVKRSESKLSSRIDNLEKSFRDELEQMRREYQSGFQSALDAIASLRHIADVKAKLDKGELKKDIRQIRRKMAALPDA